MASPATNFTADSYRRVKVLYDYDYIDDTDHCKVWMNIDEIFYLLNSDGNDWWQVCRPDSPEDPFYVPSAYVTVLSDVSGTSRSIQQHVDNNINIQTNSILGNTVEKSMLSSFKTQSVESVGEGSEYINTVPKKEFGNSDSKEIKVQSISKYAKRPTDLVAEDDYVNLDQYRDQAGLPALVTSSDPPSPKTPEEMESEYANLQELNIAEPTSEPTSPDLENSQFQRTLQDTWDVYRDMSNRLFYVNKDTKETLWKPPRGQFHEELNRQRSGASSPAKSPSSEGENKPNFSVLRNKDKSHASDRFAKSRSVMIENLHFNPPPTDTGPPPPKSATLPLNYTAPIHEDPEPIEGWLKCRIMNAKKPLKKWGSMFVKLGGSNLVFYKDQKSSQPKSGSQYGKCEQLVSLATSTIDKDTEKLTNKKLTFCITCPDCQILLQAENQLKLQEWFMKIHTRIQELTGCPGSPISVPTTTEPLTPEPETVNRKPSFKRSGHNRKPSDTGTLERKGRIKNVLEKFMLSRSDKDKLIKKGIYKDAVFGADMKQLCAKDKTKVPTFVTKSIAAIEKRGLEHEGIYRVGGNISQIQKLRCMVDQGEHYDLADPIWDVNVLTGTLKLFFRELKDPLFTIALFDKFLKSFLHEKASERLKGIKTSIEELPKPHFETMKVLFKHLTNVMDQSKENKMAAHPLAIVFGPTLIWPEVQLQNMATSVVYQSRIVEFVLLEYKTIFR